MMSAPKDRDDDLLLFRELRRRANISLLQPVSDEFEPSNYAGALGSFYRIASSNKKSSGNELLAENDKKDFNWLKTPPATPLFPSLEFESGSAELAAVVHRELPIIQPPLSRFAGNSKDANHQTTPPPRTKPKIPPGSTNPGHRPSSSSQACSGNNRLVPAVGATTRLNAESRRTNGSPSNYKAAVVTIEAKSIGMDSDSKSKKPSGRGVVSPLVRSTPQFAGFSNETTPPPPNLRNGRPSSASRGRPAAGISKSVMTEAQTRRQSCSPSVMRGRKEPDRATEAAGGGVLSSQRASSAQIRGHGSSAVVVGSRMVEKMMNARKSGVDPKKPPASSCQPNASSIGRMKKHTVTNHHLGTIASRSSSRSSSCSSGSGGR